jgi:hypothetical protein
MYCEVMLIYHSSSTLILPYKPIWTKRTLNISRLTPSSSPNIPDMLNFLLYHTFLLFVHYMHENVSGNKYPYLFYPHFRSRNGVSSFSESNSKPSLRLPRRLKSMSEKKRTLRGGLRRAHHVRMPA